MADKQSIKQIEPREARGKQFLCSLLGNFEVRGTSPRDKGCSQYSNERVIWYKINRKAGVLKRMGLKPKYVIIDETLVSTFDNYSRTYAYCAIFLRDKVKRSKQGEFGTATWWRERK